MPLPPADQSVIFFPTPSTTNFYETFLNVPPVHHREAMFNHGASMC
jgi:hypothetical protein